MSDFIAVAKTSDIPSGKMKTVISKGKQIAIVNVDGSFFAIDDLCTHAQCSLGGEGSVDGMKVVCGCHGSQFDIKNGNVLNPPATQNLGSYEVKVEGDIIFARV